MSPDQHSISKQRTSCAIILFIVVVHSLIGLGQLSTWALVLALATLAFCPTWDIGGNTLAVPISVHDWYLL